MIKLVQAELRRGFYNKSNLVFTAIAILCSVLFLSFRFVAVFDSDTAKALVSFQDTFAFPNSVFSLVSLSYTIFFFLTPPVTALLIGADYQFDTWKMVLPRTPKRGSILFAKTCALVIYLLYLFAIVIVIYQICSIVGAIWLNTSPFSNSHFLTIEGPREGFTNMLASFSFITWYVSIGIFTTIISRSVMIGTFSSFFSFAICNLIKAYSPAAISIWFAPTHFGNLIPRPESIVPIFDSSRPDCSTFISWIVVLSHIFGAYLISLIVLKKQQFTSR